MRTITYNINVRQRAVESYEKKRPDLRVMKPPSVISGLFVRNDSASRYSGEVTTWSLATLSFYLCYSNSNTNEVMSRRLKTPPFIFQLSL